MKYKIISIIVTYNRKKLLAEALKSLLKQTYSLYKIIIVDNASSDDSHAYLDNLGLLKDNVIYEYLDQNMGGAGGFYHGIKVALNAGADWVSLSDDDAIFNKDYFEKIKAQMEKYPETQAFAGSVYEGGKICSFHRGKLASKITYKFNYFDDNFYKKEVFPIDVFSFVGCVINTSIIRKIGLPYRDYFIRNDDAEYSIRIGKQTDIFCVPKAIVDHRVKTKQAINLKNETLPDWKDYYDLRNHSFLAIDHSSHKILTYIYIFTNLVARGCYALMKGKYKGHRKYRILMLWDIMKDIILNKKGKNEKYLPTVEKSKILRKNH